LASPLDRANLLLVLRGTWLFAQPLDSECLQHGLAQLLVLYPHLAGRMVKGERIDCNNAGVSWRTEQRLDLTLRDVMTGRISADTFADKINIRRVKHGRQSPMTVRVTQLCDGAVLSVCCSHGVLDGRGFYTMVSNWGRICAARPIERPILDQSLLPSFAMRSKAEMVRHAQEAGWQKLSWWSLLSMLPKLLFGGLLRRTGPFYFSPEAIQRLHQTVQSELGSSVAFTDNDVLSGYLANICALLHNLPKGTPCTQVTVLDMRQRITSLPRSFVGNAAWVVRGAQFAAGTPCSEIARRTREAVEPFLQRPSEPLLDLLRLGLESMHHRVFWLPYDLPSMHNRRPTLTYINNFARLPIYDVDFGDDRHPIIPIQVIPHNLPDPVLIWPASPERGGVEVYFTGVAAKAVHRQDPQGHWWHSIRHDMQSE
jgi:hypothetical protein